MADRADPSAEASDRDGRSDKESIKDALRQDLGSDEDRIVVEADRDEIKEFVKKLTADDIRSGGWFTKLLEQGVRTYADRVDWRYFQERYAGVPPDAVVDQRIKMAVRYAGIEGALSASAYTAAIALTITSGGGASPATVPAAAATVLVDVVYLSQLQIRLAYDIAVLYRIEIDLSDPEDLWHLIGVAFTIRSGEAVRESVIKIVPPLVRPLIKMFYKGAVLQAARGLPVVGRYLLQRNVIKVGIPLVGVPLAYLINRYSTKVVGRHARAVYRNQARVAEVARQLVDRTAHPRLMLWVSWLVINADRHLGDDEALLFRHLVRLVRERHGIVDDELQSIVDITPDDVWQMIADEDSDLSDVVDAAKRVAMIDGEINKHERVVLDVISQRCQRAPG